MAEHHMGFGWSGKRWLATVIAIAIVVTLAVLLFTAGGGNGGGIY